MKHTPGPWEVRDPGAEHDWVEIRGTHEKGFLLDDVATLFNVRSRMGDAHLIAAAPELLEACKEILDCQDHFYTEQNGTRLPVQLKPWAGPLKVIFETAREAIAKAEGRDE